MSQCLSVRFVGVETGFRNADVRRRRRRLDFDFDSSQASSRPQKNLLMTGMPPLVAPVAEPPQPGTARNLGTPNPLQRLLATLKPILLRICSKCLADVVKCLPSNTGSLLSAAVRLHMDWGSVDHGAAAVQLNAVEDAVGPSQRVCFLPGLHIAVVDGNKLMRRKSPFLLVAPFDKLGNVAPQQRRVCPSTAWAGIAYRQRGAVM